jgi:hypothetical protein
LKTNKLSSYFSVPQIVPQIHIFTMEAKDTFHDVLKYIEKSELNYMMNKTPYSANIFLKSSFIKRFDDDASKKRFVEDETTMVDLKEENLCLKEKLEITLRENRKLEKKVGEVTTEKERIERLLKQEKVKMIS